MKFNKILDILYPRRCPVCGDITGGFGRMICPECLRKLSFVRSPVCKKCGKEIEDESMEFCPDCMRHSRAFEYGIALLNYDEAARHSMAQIKYNNKREYLDFYGTALAARYGRTIRRMHADALVPVPIHATRKKTRGFNQAELLARVIGKKLELPVLPEILVRNKKTLPQKDLSAAERLKNLSGAFAAGEIPDGIRSVILVDDIYTTGSTIEACARALRAAGVERVYFVVICMTGGR